MMDSLPAAVSCVDFAQIIIIKYIYLQERHDPYYLLPTSTIVVTAAMGTLNDFNWGSTIPQVNLLSCLQ